MKLSVPTLTDFEVVQIVKPIKRKRTQSARTNRERTERTNRTLRKVETSDGVTYLYQDKSLNAQYRDRCKNIKRPKAYTARFNYTDWLEVQRRNAYVHITKDDIFRF
jgi:hypothetical protein